MSCAWRCSPRRSRDSPTRSPPARARPPRTHLMPSPLIVALLLAAPIVDSVPLYDNLGRHHHEISSSVPKAQLYFDQGLRLTYAFNHGEAIRAFNEAARLDP